MIVHITANRPGISWIVSGVGCSFRRRLGTLNFLEFPLKRVRPIQARVSIAKSKSYTRFVLILIMFKIFLVCCLVASVFTLQ